MIFTQIIFIVLFILAVVNRILALQESRISRSVSTETRFVFIMGLAGLSVVNSFLFALNPEWYSNFQGETINEVNFIGNLFIVLAILLWIASKRQLGLNWSPRIAIRDKHTITNTGPYRFVRHPIYSSYILLSLGVILATTNPMVFLPYCLTTLIVLSRVPQEEKALRNFFGPKYEEYSLHTGKLFPKLF